MYEVNIRKATMEDADVVYDMLCKLSQKEYDRTRFITCYKRNIADNNIIYLMADVGSVPSGFISCHSQQLLHHIGTAYEIQEMYINEAYRGKGIGKQLLTALQTLIAATEYDVLEVTSSNWREDAHAFYMNNGFKQTHLKLTQKGNR